MAVPLIVAGAAAAAGAIGGGIAAASKAGHNNRRAGAFYSDPKSGYDPNAKFFGGTQGGAQQYTGQMDAARGRVDARSAPVSMGAQANYRGANSWEAAQLGGRNGQDQVAMMMHQRAQGLTPSIAGAQATQDQALIQQGATNQIGLLQQNAAMQQRQALAQQAAQQASARGAAGAALAGQNAANNAANINQGIGQQVAQQTGNIGMMAAQAGQNVGNQAQINAMQERAQAEQAAFGAWSGMRGGDQAAQQQQAQQAQFQAGLNQQNNQFNTSAQLQSRSVNDARAMGYEQLGFNAQNANLQAGMQNQAILAGSYNNSEGLNQQVTQKNADASKGFIEKMIPSDARSKEGMDIHTLMKSEYEPPPEEEKSEKSGMDMGAMMGMASMAGKFMSPGQAKRPLSMDEMLDDRYQANQSNLMARADRDPEAFFDWAYADGGKQSRSQGPDYRGGDPETDFDWYREAEARHAAGGGERPPPQQDAVAQWERSFGSADGARDAARQHDNQAEAQKIRAGFERDAGKRQPWWMTPVNMTSDEKAKRPLDDDPFKPAPSTSDAVAAKQREGRRDPKVFKRDTPRDQRKVKEAYFASLSKDATDQIAAMRASLGRGASVALNEGELDDEPGDTRTAMVSDEKAKREMYIRGLQNGHDLATGGEPMPTEESIPKWDPKAKPVKSAKPTPREIPANTDAYISERAAPRGHPDAAEGRERAAAAAQERLGEPTPPPEGTFGDSPGALPPPVPPPVAGNPPRRPPSTIPTLPNWGEYRGMNRPMPHRQRMTSDEKAKRPLSPDRGPLSDANRAMIGTPYAYKDQYAPPHEKPGQPHFGFMTQNLKKSPIAAVAVEKNPETGMDAVDRDRMLQVVAAGVSDLQRQQDETRVMIGKGRRKGRG